MMIIELTDWHPRVRANRARHAGLHQRIREAGYHAIFKDTTNTIFLRDGVDAIEPSPMPADGRDASRSQTGSP
jgi:hypothetical protein